ncbi:MAG: hypothetical protein M1816_005565 [Peltula sp. TS41687]|nr:MAG: hypothetical protein M1816_005565 [Peltula sp. TS41687]
MKPRQSLALTKQRKAREDEGGAPSMNESRLGSWLSHEIDNAKANIVNGRNKLGALINKSTSSSSSGMLHGVGGGVVTPVFAGPSL